MLDSSLCGISCFGDRGINWAGDSLCCERGYQQFQRQILDLTECELRNICTKKLNGLSLILPFNNLSSRIKEPHPKGPMTMSVTN